MNSTGAAEPLSNATEMTGHLNGNYTQTDHSSAYNRMKYLRCQITNQFSHGRINVISGVIVNEMDTPLLFYHPQRVYCGKNTNCIVHN